MKRKFVLLLAAVAAVSIVGAASAQQGGNPPGQPGLQEGGRGGSIVRELLQIVTNDLSIEPAALLEQLQDQTLAEVIAANGGDLAAITADVTAAITERVNAAVENGSITQERADEFIANLPERIDNAINGEFRALGGLRPGLRDQFGARGGMFGSMLRQDARPLINAAADATGLTAREIAEQIRAGSTLSEVISANGSTPEAVVAAALEAAQTRLDEAVANGRLTQQQADDMLTGLQAFYEAAISGLLRPDAPSDTISFTSDAAV